MPTVKKSKHFNAGLKLFLAAFIVRSIWFIVAYMNGSEWFVHDSKQFLLLTTNLLEHGEFSRSLQAPFFPDIARTPGYPFFLSLFQSIGFSIGAIAFVQVLISAMIPPLMHSCGVVMKFKHPFFAASLLCIDFAMVMFAPLILSDGLFLFLLALWFWTLLQSIHQRKYVIVSGLILGALILVRPIAQFLPVVLLLWWVWQKMNKRTLMVMLVATVILPAGWISRNYQQFQTFSLSSMGSNNLLFYNAAGIIAEEKGQDLTTAQSLLARSAKATQDWENDPLATKKYLKYCKTSALDIILEHPLTFVKQTAISATLMPFKPPRSYVDLVLNLDYKYAPVQGLTNSKNLNEKISGFWKNTSPTALTLTFYQLVLNLIVFGLACMTIFKGWKDNKWISLLVLLVLYFWMTSLVTQPDARFRMPMGIFLALLAGNASLQMFRTKPFARHQKN